MGFLRFDMMPFSTGGNPLATGVYGSGPQAFMVRGHRRLLFRATGVYGSGPRAFMDQGHGRLWLEATGVCCSGPQAFGVRGHRGFNHRRSRAERLVLPCFSFAVDNTQQILILRVPIAGQPVNERAGGMPEWLKGTGCKPVDVRLRWFESNSLHQFADARNP